MLDSDGIDEEIVFRTLDAMIDDQTLCVAYNLHLILDFTQTLPKYVQEIIVSHLIF